MKLYCNRNVNHDSTSDSYHLCLSQTDRLASGKCVRFSIRVAGVLRMLTSSNSSKIVILRKVLLSLSLYLWQCAFVQRKPCGRRHESGVGFVSDYYRKTRSLDLAADFRQAPDCNIPIQVQEHHSCTVLSTTGDFQDSGEASKK